MDLWRQTPDFMHCVLVSLNFIKLPVRRARMKKSLEYAFALVGRAHKPLRCVIAMLSDAARLACILMRA